MRGLFTQERVAASANLFLDGLLGDERRKTGWMRAEAAGDPGPWRQQTASEKFGTGSTRTRSLESTDRTLIKIQPMWRRRSPNAARPSRTWSAHFGNRLVWVDGTG